MKTKAMQNVTTPLGEELVDTSWLEEPTRVLSADETRAILEITKRLDNLENGVHTKPTIRMPAVRVVPRPDPRPRRVV